MFRFFCHMFYRHTPFEDMYCLALRMLDRIVVELDADYADFNTVQGDIRRYTEIYGDIPMPPTPWRCETRYTLIRKVYPY